MRAQGCRPRRGLRRRLDLQPQPPSSRFMPSRIAGSLSTTSSFRPASCPADGVLARRALVAIAGKGEARGTRTEKRVPRPGVETSVSL
jgi:hypothetical protein